MLWRPEPFPEEASVLGFHRMFQVYPKWTILKVTCTQRATKTTVEKCSASTLFPTAW